MSKTSVGQKDRTTFGQLPEQIKKHYKEYAAKYAECSMEGKGSADLSTWIFGNVWLRENTDLELNLPPQAVLQFFLEPGWLWIDCWEKTTTGWVLTHSSQSSDGQG
jgi:hypothetical protein